MVRNQDPSGEVRQSSSEVWLYDLSAAELQHMRTSAVDQALEKIRNRIDAFGVSEPSISKQGTQRIVVQLPGLQDTQRAIDLIGKTAQLELKLVHSQPTTPGATPSWYAIPAPEKEGPQDQATRRGRDILSSDALR